MRIQIRRGVFETNSSSTHSLILCKQSDWDNFMHGKMVMKGFPYNPVLVPAAGIDPNKIFKNYITDDCGDLSGYPEEYDYMSWEGWCNIECIDEVSASIGDIKAVSIYYSEE